MGADYETSFFESKRPWSEVKDAILRQYLPPYLKKVNHLRRPILLVDAYAGQGIFGDSKAGSPLIIAEYAERFVPGRYQAIFNNIRKVDHLELQKNLLGTQIENQNVVSKGPFTLTRLDARDLLRIVRDEIRHHTLFLFLDPMGIKNASFDVLASLLRRVTTGFSTEVLLRMDFRSLHRHGARLARKNPKNPSQLQQRVENIDDALGGTWWRAIEWDETLQVEEREGAILQGFMNRLQEHADIRYVVSCPVQERGGKAPKYYLVFCSRHEDALVLMNDAMLKSYDDFMHKQAKPMLPLFGAMEPGDLYDWERQRLRRIKQLRKNILAYLADEPRGISRYQLHARLVEDHFLSFRGTEYRNLVKKLVEENFIYVEKGVKGLNDNCTLYLAKFAPI